MDINDLIIIKYENKYKELWDDFVKNAVFGTVYHTRFFINYHPKDRFIDYSILLFNKTELICVIPACKRNITDELFFSYTGATYGGPVFLKKYYNSKYIKIIIDLILNYYNHKLELRLANNIYFKDEPFMLYCTLGCQLKMVPEMSWYINNNNNFIDNINNKRNKNNLIKMINDPTIICFNTNNITYYSKFYTILQEGLKVKHNTFPTHTYDEFISLKTILHDKQALYLVEQDNIILGGVYVIKVTNQCWYTFYISKNINTNNHAAILYLMYTIHKDAKNENVPYLDYGICTENQGKYINLGLSEFKENSLGGISNSRYLFLQN